MIRQLTRTWLWLHLAVGAALLWHPSTPAVLLGRYSRNASLLLLGVAITAPVVVWAARWLPTVRTPIRLPCWAVWVLLAGGVGVLWGLPVASAAPYKVMRLYLTYVTFTGAVWLSGDEDSVTAQRAAPILAALTALVVVGAAFRFPGVLWTDEGYMVGAALGFNQYGIPRPLLWGPYEGASFSLAYMGMGVWLRVFGATHLAARFYVLALAFLTVSVSWVAARRVYGPVAAWGAAIAALGGVLWLNVLRQDILVGLYVSIGLLLYIIATEKKLHWLHLLVGLIVGFSVDGHPLAYRIGLGFGLAYAVEYGRLIAQERRVVFWSPFFLLAAGGLAGAAGFIFFYRAITPYIGNLAQTSPFTLGWHGASVFGLVRDGLMRLPVVVGLASGGAVLALRRSTPLTRVLLSVLLLHLIVFAFLYPIWRWYYLAHLIPVFVLLGAGALAALPEKAQTLATVAVTAATVGFVALGFFQRSQDYRPALAVADAIDAALPPETSIAGVDPFYLRMTEREFFAQQIITIIAQQEAITIPEAWRFVGPDAVTIVGDYPLAPPAGLLDYIEEKDMVRVRCWEVETLGEVELFMAAPTISVEADCQPLMP